MKIKVVNSDETDASFGKFLLRSLIMPIYASVFLYTPLKSITLVILVFILKPWGYFYANGVATLILALYCYLDVIILMASKNHTAVHDKILKTKVINYVRTK